jgi:hypothetical protein
MENKSFSGKFVENGGVSAADLERGYLDTGAIPEEGESISGAQAAADKEAKEAADYRAMCKKNDWDCPEPTGGFLDDCCE